nr:reverse transcriptase domain-containing protein [Tanacetum cinerariifolium]
MDFLQQKDVQTKVIPGEEDGTKGPMIIEAEMGGHCVHRIGQAPERNKAICEEVEKLVDTDIMKEVHYHSWLSNTVMVKAVLKLPSPKCLKDVQKLNEKLASLNRFLSKSAEKYLPFFKNLKKFTKKSNFQWIAEAEMAFKQMKILIAKLPMLTAPKEKEELIMYLATAKEAISAILTTEKDGKQMPIYFVSRNGKAAQMEIRTRRARHSVPTKDVSKRTNSGVLHRVASGGRHTRYINGGYERTPRPMDIIHGRIIM